MEWGRPERIASFTLKSEKNLCTSTCLSSLNTKKTEGVILTPLEIKSVTNLETTTVGPFPVVNFNPIMNLRSSADAFCLENKKWPNFCNLLQTTEVCHFDIHGAIFTNCLSLLWPNYLWCLFNNSVIVFCQISLGCQLRCRSIRSSYKL